MGSPDKRRVFLRAPPDADRVERAIARILAIPGVLSAFLGAPRRAGRRHLRGYAICVRVVAKRSAGQDFVPIPPLVEGIPTDVEAVGEPTTQVAAAGQAGGARVVDPADPRTPGTVSALTAAGEVLLSGHASLPWSGGAIVRQLDGGAALVLVGDAVGRLLRGRVGPTEDWAIGSLSAVLDPVHPVPGAAPPFPRAAAAQGTVLRHQSRLSGARRGRVTSAGPNVRMPMRLPDGTTNVYDGLYEVEPLGASGFSAPGDSGSLVFDGLGRAVGVVVGGASGLTRTYVLPLPLGLPFFSG